MSYHHSNSVYHHSNENTCKSSDMEEQISCNGEGFRIKIISMGSPQVGKVCTFILYFNFLHCLIIRVVSLKDIVKNDLFQSIWQH